MLHYRITPSATRRSVLALGAAGLIAASVRPALASPKKGADLIRSSYGGDTLPAGVRSRMIHGINGLDVHILEAGFENPDRPL